MEEARLRPHEEGPPAPVQRLDMAQTIGMTSIIDAALPRHHRPCAGDPDWQNAVLHIIGMACTRPAMTGGGRAFSPQGRECACVPQQMAEALRANISG
jgi:hypothetical protein